jgi:hypothetical protein
MIGLFLRNKADAICFVQVSKGQDIESFHYSSDARMMSVTMKDGAEETITSEIAPEIGAVLKSSDILVVQLDTEGEFDREYNANLTVG